MAIEPVNERPIFPALIRADGAGVGTWSVSMIRQLTTVFQQYGYRLNAALLTEDLDTESGEIVTVGGDPVLRDSDLSANGGTVAEVDEAQTWTATQTFTPVQVFSASPTATGHPLRFDELAENGGSIPETDRANTFAPVQEFTAMPTVGGDAIVESGSNANGSWVKWADGTMDQWGFHFDTVDITSNGNVLSGFRNNSVGHTLPQAFVSTTGMVVVASNHFDSGVGTHVLDLNVNTLSYLTTEFRLVWASEASQTAQDVAASWHAKGRWK